MHEYINWGIPNQPSQCCVPGAFDALAERDREHSLNILQRAFDTLETVPISEEQPHMAVSVACSLLPTVAKIDKRLIDTTEQPQIALSALEQVVGLVALDETERWNWLLDEQYQLWRPDKFDFQ